MRTDFFRQQVDSMRGLLNPELIKLIGEGLEPPLFEPLHQVDTPDRV